jgi:hypothetical protein
LAKWLTMEIFWQQHRIKTNSNYFDVILSSQFNP